MCQGEERLILRAGTGWQLQNFDFSIFRRLSDKLGRRGGVNHVKLVKSSRGSANRRGNRYEIF